MKKNGSEITSCVATFFKQLLSRIISVFQSSRLDKSRVLLLYLIRDRLDYSRSECRWTKRSVVGVFSCGGYHLVDTAFKFIPGT